MDYRKVLSEIDESLAQEYKRRGRYNSVITRLMNEFLAQYPEKKNEARDIFYTNADDNDIWDGDWVKLYLSIFNDKESCLKLLDDERFCFGDDILKSNQEADVVVKVLEKSPSAVVDFLKKYPEKKEEYKQWALRFFDRVMARESNRDYRFSQFFSIYKNDTALWLDILDKNEFDKELYQKIVEVCHDEEVINKMLAKLAKLPETGDIADIYCHIVRVTKDEDVCQRILEQTDNTSVVNRMALDGSDFSSEFKEKILHHPNLSYFAWWNGPQKYMPDSAFDDEVLERMLQKFPTETYNTYTETTINNVLLYILRHRANPEFARKVFDCCQNIKDYDNQSFRHYYEENVLLGILKNDTSDEMFQQMLEYVIKNGRTEFFEKLVSLRPNADTLKRIEAYYQAHYKEKAKAKEEMKKESSDKGEKEQFDYIGYYQTMKDVWYTVVENTNDLQLLDNILLKHTKIKTKAQRKASQIKETYNKNSAKESIQYAQNKMEETYHKKGYIRQKLKTMYPKLSFENAIAKLFKQMQTTTDKKEKTIINTILMVEGFDFYVDFIKNCEGKIDARIRDYVLKEKEKMIEKLPKYSEYEREDVYNEAQKIEVIFKEKNVIATTLKETYPDLSFEQALIKEAARVVKSGDEKEKERFNNFLLAEGEERLLNVIDRDVCDYLVDHFTKKNLEDVNALRSFYGLKIIIDETPFETPNLRTVRRMQFDDSVSTTDPNSEYYVVQYSEAYRNFVPNKRRRFKESDYYDMMDKSEAFQTLFDYGYADFAYTLPQALAKAHVPPEVAEQFNIKDLQAVFYYTLPDEEKDVYGWDGDFLFTKKWIEIESEYDEADLMGARKSYWMDMVANKQLVATMKTDLMRHGVSKNDADKLFEMAEEEGRPNAGRKWERVTSVKLPLHHVLGLKDGGLNYPRNYAPVVIYEDGLNSHTPLHRYDTPKDVFYMVEGAKLPTDVMLTRLQPSHDAKVVRIRTIFTDDEINPHKKVLFYGGARKNSRYVGRLHGMENIALKAEKLGKEYRERDAKAQLLMQIVFQNYVDMHNRLAEVESVKKNKEKKKKISVKKEKMRKTVKIKGIKKSKEHD